MIFGPCFVRFITRDANEAPTRSYRKPAVVTSAPWRTSGAEAICWAPPTTSGSRQRSRRLNDLVGAVVKMVWLCERCCYCAGGGLPHPHLVCQFAATRPSRACLPAIIVRPGGEQRRRPANRFRQIAQKHRRRGAIHHPVIARKSE